MVNTPLRAVRIEDGLWRAAQARAAARGETVTDVLRRALRRYTGGYGGGTDDEDGDDGPDQPRHP